MQLDVPASLDLFFLRAEPWIDLACRLAPAGDANVLYGLRLRREFPFVRTVVLG